jgi:hypothetical protein
MKLKELLNQCLDVELTEEQEEQIRKYLGVKPKRWKPEHSERYYYVDCYGEVDVAVFDENDELESFGLLTNNCFKTREEAEFRLEQIKVYYELKNFADENNDEIDWNRNTCKYCICTDRAYGHPNLHISRGIYSQTIGQIYFSSEQLAQQAIDKIGANRIKKYLFEV